MMFIAAGACYLMATYLDRPSLFVSEFQEGVSVVAIFVGLCVATPIELVFSLMEKMLSETRRK